MTTLPVPPVTAFNRAELNQRRIRQLIACAIVLAIPFIWGTSFVVAQGITWQVTRQAHLERFHQLRLQRFDRQSDDLANHRVSSRDLKNSKDSDLRADLALAGRYTPDEQSMRTKILAICALGIAALLGLLVWTGISSPARKLMTEEGARPAGPPERETQEALKRLAAAAGIPVPRLYIIDTTALNAFSAGLRPEYSIVAVSRGMLMALDAAELDAVLAHEISRIRALDTRLNTFVAWIAQLLRMRTLVWRKRKLARQLSSGHPSYRKFRLGYSLMMAPVFTYVFALAPVLAALVRRAVSGREFVADADAAALTGNPEALMRALAKAAGAGSALASSNPAFAHLYFAEPTAPGGAMGLLRNNLFAPHPPLQQRVERLSESGGIDCAASVETAFDAGRVFIREHPQPSHSDIPEASSSDELAFVSAPNPMGRVFRVVSEGSPIYDHDNTSSMVVDRVQRGDLLVVFDDPGKMRQVITVKDVFGYLPFSVKLHQEDLLPAEIHTAAARNLALDVPVEPAAPVSTAPAALVATAARMGLTARQMFLCAGFGVVVFAGMLLALVELGGK